jgi:recombination protein RecA
MSTKPLVVEDFLIPANLLREEEGRVFRTTISMDIALSGGIPEGTSVLLSGKPKIGKTTLALHYVQQCHRKDPSKKAFFFDVEGRLRTELVDCFPDINKENLNIVRSNSTKILSAEDYLNLIFQTLKDNEHSICILDSIAALCPEGELSSNIGDSVKMAGTATLMYKIFKRVSQILPVTHSTFIALTHMIANPNPGPGKKSYAVGGNAPQYGASVWLEAAWKQDINDSANKTIGQNAHFNVIASALGAPGAEVTVPIIYGRGVDEHMDLFNICCELGLIQKAGAWYSIGGAKEKIQGQLAVVELLRKDEKLYSSLLSQVEQMAMPCK